ncbi:MAG: hypothetical protein Q8867_11275, partial [Bacteroidota bacterium]|nr:hypothetical protein [Bacteroidota bacterium]
MPPIHIKSSVLKIERSEWSAFVANHPSGNAFQAPEIYDIFKQIKDYTPIVLGAFDDQEKLAGILLAVIQKEHAGITGRFTARTIVWGGPLVSASAEEPGKVAGLLVDALIGQTAKKSVYIEFRNLAESRWYNAFSGSGFQYLPYINAILPLEGESMEKILSGMKYNRRREIRISVEEGATYGEAQSSQEVRSLYKILHDLYRKRVKVPLPPYEMFEAIFKSHAGKIFVVKHGDRVIG